MPVHSEASDPKIRHYPETRFGGFTDADQVVLFYTRVRALLNPESVVLDVGCGRGAHVDEPIAARRHLRNLSHAAGRLVGLDVDPAAAQNPSLDEFHLISPQQRWPVASGSVDLVLADYVLEHVEHPELFLDECRRVLRPGGHLCMRTTNALSYFGLAARLVPDRAHGRWVQRLYRHPRGREDVFPTHFRCNTVGKIRRALRLRGFQACVYGHQADPAHFAFSSLVYRLGVLHQRLAPHRIKPTIFIFARLHSENWSASA